MNLGLAKYRLYHGVCVCVLHHVGIVYVYVYVCVAFMCAYVS